LLHAIERNPQLVCAAPSECARMKKRLRMSAWAKTFERSFVAMSRMATASGSRVLAKTLKPVVAKRAPPPGAGAWIPGVVMGATGARLWAETHEAWLGDNRYINMDLLKEQKKAAMKIAA
jgi:hypothetical protein